MDQYLQKISQSDDKEADWFEKDIELKCKITYKLPPVQLDDGCKDDATTTCQPKLVTKFIRSYDELRALQASEHIQDKKKVDDYDDEFFEERTMKEAGYCLDNGNRLINDIDINPAPDRLVFLMRQLISHHMKTNVQIGISDVYICCHLCVLQAYSKFFFDIEYALIITLPSDKVSMNAFLIIYQWMITDKPKLPRKDIAAVFLAGTYLHIDELLDHCWGYFDGDKYFYEDAASLFYVETSTNPALNVVSSAMLMRINRFFLPFVASSHFVELPIRHLIYLLGTRCLGVNSEVEVFYSAVRWFEHKWDERTPHIFRVFKHIRYDLMPGWFLLNLPNCRETKSIRYIMSVKKMSLLVHQAIADVTVFLYDGLMKTHFKEGTIERVLIDHSLNQRLWVEDRTCHFHHHISCTEMTPFKYVDFLGYLLKLQSMSPKYWFEAIKPIDRSIPCCKDNKLFRIMAQ